jgi:uncharacterized protein (TIGR02246 family)
MLLLGGISCAPRGKSSAEVETELRGATEQYATLVRNMDSAGIAAMYTDDGAMGVVGQPLVQGPKAIESFLEKFKEFQVQSEKMTVQSVAGSSDKAHVTGRYDQSVRLPAGNVVEVHGGFAADWVRLPSGSWRIHRMQAIPDKTSAAPASGSK